MKIVFLSRFGSGTNQHVETNHPELTNMLNSTWLE